MYFKSWHLVSLALLIPIMWACLKSRRQSLVFPGISEARAAIPHNTGEWFEACCRTLIMLLLIGALIRPQVPGAPKEHTVHGTDMVLCVDLSDSMTAMDFENERGEISRLEAVKEILAGFIRGRSHDRLALVAFGTEARTRCPLTVDHEALLESLQMLQAESLGKMTSIGEAIGISLKRLDASSNQSRAIVLITDGKSNSGSLPPVLAARLAAERKVRIHTILVGKSGRAPFLIPDPVFGERRVYKQVEADPETLRRISSITGGRFWDAQSREALSAIQKAIDETEKKAYTVKRRGREQDLYPMFLLAAMGLMLVQWAGMNTRFLRLT